MNAGDNLNRNQGGQMTTMEKLFVQVFERKKMIIDQVKHQIDLFDHHLASICVLDGLAPPPWLLSPSFPSVSSGFNEMRKEELISGLILQRSQSVNHHFNSHYPSYQEPIVTSHNKGIPNASRMEVYASNNGTNAGDMLSAMPPSPTDDAQCTSNGVPELDGSVTSPPDCADVTLLDNCHVPSASLAKIQRSKSRQRALELRNSAKAKKQKSCANKHTGVHTSQGTGSKINPLQYNLVDELVLAKNVDANNELIREESKNTESAGKEMKRDIGYNRTLRSGSFSQQIDSVNETGNDGNLSCIAENDGLNMSLNCPIPPPNCVIGLSDPFVLANSSSVAEANLVDSRGTKKKSIECCDKTAESWNLISQVNIQNEPFEAGNTSCVAEIDHEDKKSLEKSINHTSSNSESSNLFKSSPVISNKSYKARKSNKRDQGIEEKDNNIYVGRMTRSRSSHCQINYKNEYLELEKSQTSSKENGLSNTKQMSDHSHELPELVKPLDTTNVTCQVEANVRDSQKFDAENNAHGCGITPSSSAEKLNDFNKSPEICIHHDVVKDVDGLCLQSLGKSSQPPKWTSFVEEGVNHLIPSGIEPYSRPPIESIRAENVTNMYYNGIAETFSVRSKSNSVGAGCGAERSESRPPSECALVVKPQQLDFDNVEDSQLHKSFNLELENKQESTSEKQLSPLLLSIDKVTLDDAQEKSPKLVEISLQKEQDVSRKQKQIRKVSSEISLKDNADLVEERTFNSAQKEVGSFISRSSSADFFFLGSWPQHKRMKIGSQLIDFPYSSLMLNPCSPSNKYHIGDALQSDAITSPVQGAGGDVEQQDLKASEMYLSKLHDNEVAINLEGEVGVDALAPVLEQAATSVLSLNQLTAGFSHDSLLDKPEMADPNHNAENNQILLQVSCTEDTIQEMKYHFGGKRSFSQISSGSPNNLSEVGTDQNMPDYEGFFMDSDAECPCTTIEGIDSDKLNLPLTALRRLRALDQLCKSTSLCTPLPHSTEAVNLFHSIPNGLLEGMELKGALKVDSDESMLFNSIYSLNEGVNNDLHVRSSQSISLLPDAQSTWDISKPCMSPVGKFWDVMPPKSGSSGKRVSSIPELPCISEENENADGLTDMLLEDSCPQVKSSLAKREILADVRKYSSTLTSVCEAKIQDDRSSIASMNTELGYSGTCNRRKKKLTDHNRRRFTSKDKENQNISLGGDDVKRSKGPLHNRFSKPKISDKPVTRKGGPSLSEKEPKRNNIVSTMTSFVPLVQQKQAAAVVNGKRDIKVKALEAAEAAKRLAEKKENERKMKKEALKIERAKMEEANLRQLELEKKKKEEKKKKDADMAAKKRQREEEDKKEKERKKMRVEEAKRNHQDNEKKIQIEKEAKFKPPDERVQDRKESKKIEKASVDNNLQTMPGTKPATIEVSTFGTINANISVDDHEALFGDNSKVTAKPSENHWQVSSVNQEQSYEISPYKCSDDEDEEEEDNMQNKYKPSWASKSQLGLVVSAQQSIDTDLLFPPEKCYSISKVLLPRKLQQM